MFRDAIRPPARRREHAITRAKVRDVLFEVFPHSSRQPDLSSLMVLHVLLFVPPGKDRSTRSRPPDTSRTRSARISPGRRPE